MLRKSLLGAAILALAPSIAFAQSAPVATPPASSPAVAPDSASPSKAPTAAVHKGKHHAMKAKAGVKTEKSVAKPAASQP